MYFWQDTAEEIAFWADYPLNVNESVSSFGKAYAKGKILSDLTADRSPELVESMSTAAVAMDMLSIAGAFGQDKVNYYGIS